MSVVRTIFLQCPSIPHFSTSSSSSNPVSVKFTVSCCSVASPVTVVNGNVDKKPYERNEVRLGLPSKGRMATDTLDLLKVMYIHTNSSRSKKKIYIHTNSIVQLISGVKILDEEFVSQDFADLFFFVFGGVGIVL